MIVQNKVERKITDETIVTLDSPSFLNVSRVNMAEVNLNELNPCDAKIACRKVSIRIESLLWYFLEVVESNIVQRNSDMTSNTVKTIQADLGKRETQTEKKIGI